MDGVVFGCPACGREYEPGQAVCCPRHNGTAPALDAVYDWETLREHFSPGTATREDVWRYRPLLPVDGETPVTLGEGWTDLVSAPALGDALGVSLSLKLEGANPTGSTKDRGSSVVATHAREQGFEGIVCASTGNAAASAAAYAARSDLECSIFVPEDVPDAKAVQPRIYGAAVETVPGSYGDAYQRCRERAGGALLDRSAGATPFPAAGARTLGYELAEQSSPGWVAVSMGNGGTAAGVWEGWQAFAEMGYVTDPPRLLGVQAAGATAIHDSLRGENDPETARTCADSIAVDEPHRGEAACRAIERSDGASVTVTDGEIRRAIRTLGREEGVFAEPASAATVAGIRRARQQGLIDGGEGVVAVVTGNGLKDTATAYDALDGE